MWPLPAIFEMSGKQEGLPKMQEQIKMTATISNTYGLY